MTDIRITADDQAKIRHLGDQIDSLFMWQEIYNSPGMPSNLNPAYTGYENLKSRIVDLIQGKPMEDRIIPSETEKLIRQKVAEYEREKTN